MPSKGANTAGQYPERDRVNNSLRRQAFLLFDLGQRPAAVARLLPLKKKTAHRYFQHWKRMPPLYWVKYELARSCFRILPANQRRMVAE